VLNVEVEFDDEFEVPDEPAPSVVAKVVQEDTKPTGSALLPPFIFTFAPEDDSSRSNANRDGGTG